MTYYNAKPEKYVRYRWLAKKSCTPWKADHLRHKKGKKEERTRNSRMIHKQIIRPFSLFFDAKVSVSFFGDRSFESYNY